MLSGEAAVLPSTIVYTTGDQSISGVKTFANPAKFNAISGDFSLDISTPYDLTLRNSIGASLGLGGEEKTVTLSGDEANFHFTNLDIYSPTQIRGKLDGSTGIFQKLYASNLVYNTGDQTISGNKNFAQNVVFGDQNQSDLLLISGETINFGALPTVNGTGILLRGEPTIVYTTGDQTINGNKFFLNDITINNLTVTGTRTITNTQESNIQSNYLLLNITGGATNGGIYFVTGAGFSGINSSGPIIAYDNNNNSFKIGTGIRSTNINSLKTIATPESVVNLTSDQTIAGVKTFSAGIGLSTISGNLSNSTSIDFSDEDSITISAGSQVYMASPLIQTSPANLGAKVLFGDYNQVTPFEFVNIHGGNLLVDRTGIFLSGIDLKNSKLNNASNVIYNTGDQTISGIKTFASRPTINNTGFLLSGEQVTDNISMSVGGTGTFPIPISGFIDSNVTIFRYPPTEGLVNFYLPFGTGVHFKNRKTTINYRNAGGATGNGQIQVYSNGGYGTPTYTLLQTYTISNNESITFVGRNDLYASWDPILADRQTLNKVSESYISINNNQIVYKTGDQTISGIKTFVSRPTINGTGVLLSGEATVLPTTIVYTTGNQSISGIKTFANGSNQILNTTYSNLTGLKATSGLLSGQLYRISDFVLKWNNQSYNDQTVKTAASGEPLIVTALSKDKISHLAQSETYPQDTIYYNINASGSYSWGTINNNLAIPDFKGWIYRRIDNVLNIDIPYDWRNITVNCCRPDVSSIPYYSGNHTYNKFDVVIQTGDSFSSPRGKLYVSYITGNSGNALNTIYWTPLSDFYSESGTYFSTDEDPEYGGFKAFRVYDEYEENYVYKINLPFDANSRIQQPTFTSSMISQGTFSLNYDSSYNLKIEGGYSNVIQGGGIQNNTIGGGFKNNTILSLRENTIGNNFANNQIGVFYNNTIGDNFAYNLIGAVFVSNYVGDNFSQNTLNRGELFTNNTIGNSFGGNTIEGGFQSNIIGNYFSQNTICKDAFWNTIGNSFGSNTIGKNFQGNTIANTYTNNTMGDSFIYNKIGNIFNNNTIGNGFNTNAIDNNFQSNTIGHTFITNTIGNSFGGNTIGNSFNSNTIGNIFEGNTIGNIFEVNTIGDYFYDNTIGNYFFGNTAEGEFNNVNFSTSTHVYNSYNTTLFTNSALSLRLRYFNSSDQLVVTDPTA